jgi:hypothetical protein
VRRLLVTANVPSSPILVTQMMEAQSPSESSVLTRATRRSIPEDGNLRLNIVPTKGREVTELGSSGLSKCGRQLRALPVIVAILFEDVPQEHQLGLQGVFIAKSSGSVYQVNSAACVVDG